MSFLCEQAFGFFILVEEREAKWTHEYISGRRDIVQIYVKNVIISKLNIVNVSTKKQRAYATSTWMTAVSDAGSFEEATVPLAAVVD
jgi:hypothetical protein